MPFVNSNKQVLISKKLPLHKNRMGGFEAGNWEIREKDWAYKDLDQFSVNYFLLRGAEEEKAMVRDEMEGVILIQNYDMHLLRQSYKLFNFWTFL